SDGEADATFWGALQRAAADSTITSTATSRKLAVFADMMERMMKEQPKLLLSELYHLILDETGYVRELRKEGTEEALARIENLEEFNTLLQEFEEDFFEKVPEAEREALRAELLPRFLEEAALVNEAIGGDVELASVKMM